MGQIRTVVTMNDEEAKAFKAALDSRQASEPVVRELRSQFSKHVPKWATKLNDSVEVDDDRIDELRTALEARKKLTEALPGGDKSAHLLSKVDAALDVLDVLEGQVAGPTASLSAGREFDPQ